MTKILTIIAKAFGATEPTASPNDSNIGLPTIWDKIDKRRRAAASSLREIVEILEDDPKAKGIDILQIVGHGMPGFLALGYHWEETYHGEGTYYALDENWRAYGTLRRQVKPVTEVRIIGCNVGARANDASVHNGPALLFALEQMWDTEVWASPGDVNPTNFEQGNGNFLGILKRYNGIVKGAPNPIPPLPTQRVDKEAPIMEVVSVKDLRPFKARWTRPEGRLGKALLANQLKIISKELEATFRCRVDIQPPLALPEWRMKVRVGEGNELFHAILLSGGRYLHLLQASPPKGQPPKAEYRVAKDNALPDQLIAHLVRLREKAASPSSRRAL